MKLKKIFIFVLAGIMMFGCFSTTSFAEDNVDYLDLETTTTKDIDQNYTFTQTSEEYTDVTKVKLTWTITDIEVTYTSNKTWDPDTLTWKETKTVGNIENKTAEFTLTNYSSKKVVGTVEFKVADDLASTLTSYEFDENNGKTIDTVVNVDYTIDETKKANVPSNTITATLEFDASKFAELTATTSATKYGTYTVTITPAPSKKDATVTAPAAKTGLSYKTSTQDLVNKGETNGGEWQYKLDDGEYSTTIPSASNAGTYTVYYKLVGGDDYNDIAEASVQVTIDKATQTAVPSAPTFTLEDTFMLGYTINLSSSEDDGQGNVQYGYSTNGFIINYWPCGENVFMLMYEQLDGATNVYFYTRYAENSNYYAGPDSAATEVTFD